MEIKRLFWWLSWVFLLTAAVFVRMEKEAPEVYRPLTSNFFFIAALIAFGCFMMINVVQIAKYQRPWASGFHNFQYANLKRQTYNDLKEFAGDETAVLAIRQRFLVRSEDAGVERTRASDEFADMLTTVRGR